MVRISLYRGINVGICCAGLLAGMALSVPKVNGVQAIQYRDGTTAFSYPLRMIEAMTTRNTIAENNPTYYIRFAFPAAAEEPLDRIVISLDEGRRDPTFSYRLEATQAIAHTPEGDEPLPLGEVTEDPVTKTLTLHFAPPVPPGNPITLALKPNRNPRFEGVYLFGVNAYPVGHTVEPNFVGYARLSFYSPSEGVWP